MAVTTTLVFSGNNRLVYLLVADAMAGTATIPNDAGASPDLQTDTVPGPLKQIATARANGIGTIAPGALTQAQARALLLSDGTTSVGNAKVPRAICSLRCRAGTLAAATVDANVDGDGDPVIAVVTAASSTYYLDIEVPNASGIAQ